MEGVQHGIEGMQVEMRRVQNIEKNMSLMMEQFAFMRSKWEEGENERKSKGSEGEKDSGYTALPENSLGAGTNIRAENGGSYQYGMTETSCVSVISSMDERDTLTGHVGSPNPACEIKLVDVPEMSYTSEDLPHPRGEI
ncbi:unnamed protein product [Fraxinus pennsylvanica]|uniref:AMP-dependent synthetase/ligase domain-containing protein n=1 Tax=Fraxinus pennsylvanica TaxID=56036 RepID=A0AAD2A6I8_9LAMI|nr:unnamed protein product [Fraxinus pennsylvanica]